MFSIGRFLIAAAAAALLLPRPVTAQEEEILLDRNGDGAVSVLAFGDSITFGVGEGTNPGQFVEFAPAPGPGGAGYPPRLSGLSGLPVSNAGSSGEFLTERGVERFPGVAGSSSADIVLIMEGTNDAGFRTDRARYRRSLQRLINVTRALGKIPVLGTLTPVCCNRAGRGPIINDFNQEIRSLATVNEIPVSDVDRAWRSTCSSFPECELLNLPEGLHPNNRGYDVIAQTALGALFEVDLFAPEGPAELESRLGLEPGTIIVKPEPQAEGAL